MYFSKKVYTVYSGVWGKAPRSWGVFENFWVNSRPNLTKGYF